GNLALAENDTGHRLDFEVLQALSLPLGETAHLGLGEMDVFDERLGQAAPGLLYLFFRHLKGGRIPLVKAARILPHCRFPASFYVRDNVGHRLTYALVDRGCRRGAPPLL